jgi:hypothetical protein
VSRDRRDPIDSRGATPGLSGGRVPFDVDLDGRDEETLACITLTRQ